MRGRKPLPFPSSHEIKKEAKSGWDQKRRDLNREGKEFPHTRYPIVEQRSEGIFSKKATYAGVERKTRAVSGIKLTSRRDGKSRGGTRAMTHFRNR